MLIEYTVMQQYHQSFTTVTSLGYLLRPTSNHALLRFKEKPYDRRKVKKGKISLSFDMSLTKQKQYGRRNMYIKTEILFLNQERKAACKVLCILHTAA
jgi:hypothetical protein